MKRCKKDKLDILLLADILKLGFAVLLDKNLNIQAMIKREAQKHVLVRDSNYISLYNQIYFNWLLIDKGPLIK